MTENKCKTGYSSPRWTGEIADCSLPVTFDTYSNCSFGCVYCFSQYQRGIGGSKEDYLAKRVKSVDPEKIKRLFGGEEPNSRTANSGSISRIRGRFNTEDYLTNSMGLRESMG